VLLYIQFCLRKELNKKYEIAILKIYVAEVVFSSAAKI